MSSHDGSADRHRVERAAVGPGTDPNQAEEQSVDLDAVRVGLANAVPFARHLHLRYVSLTPNGALVCLPDREEFHNHFATQHAGALFTVAEAASGAAFVAAFVDHLHNLRPVVTRADIDFIKTARGLITASAQLADDRRELLTALEREQRVEFSIGVELTDEDQQRVATARMTWYVRATEGARQSRL